MTNLVAFKQAGLPSVQALTTALKSIKAPSNEFGIIIKMDKTGHWVFGSDSTEIEDNAEWAVNPFSFIHGFIAWGAREVLGENMVAITEPLPELEPAPTGAKKGWESQVGFSLKCLNGEDAGMEMRYSATSTGGKKAVQALAIAIAEQVEKDATKPVAIVVLGSDHYIHKEFGKVYTPVFEILDWVTMDGEAAEETEAVPEIEAPKEEAPKEAAPSGRRSRGTAPAEAPADAPATTRRRRAVGG